jgi:hypothetical protein
MYSEYSTKIDAPFGLDCMPCGKLPPTGGSAVALQHVKMIFYICICFGLGMIIRPHCLGCVFLFSAELFRAWNVNLKSSLLGVTIVVSYLYIDVWLY